jgi:hypothetical protein
MRRLLALAAGWWAVSIAWGLFDALVQRSYGVHFPVELRRDDPRFRRAWTLAVVLGRTVELVEPDGERRHLRPAHRGPWPTLRRLLFGWAAWWRPPRERRGAGADQPSAGRPGARSG